MGCGPGFAGMMNHLPPVENAVYLAFSMRMPMRLCGPPPFPVGMLLDPRNQVVRRFLLQMPLSKSPLH